MLPRVLLPLVPLAAILVAWSAIAAQNPPYVLPGPGLVWSALMSSFGNGSLGPAVGQTLTEAALGWAIGLAVAVPLGYLAGKFWALEWAVAPYLAGAYAAPALAIAPLLFLWTGLGVEPKVVLAALVSFFPMMANTTAAVHGVQRDLRDVAVAFGARWWQRVIYLEAAQCARTILAGARIGMALAVVGAYVGEFLNPDAGLGAFILTNNATASSAATAAAFAGVICVMVLAAGLYTLITLVEIQILRLTE